jgi:diadenosine tetraphosphate (Ap4A) HIT family hydrolase
MGIPVLLTHDKISGVPWWDAEQWEAMRAGSDCPMCSDAHLPINVHSDLLTETPASYIRLVKNQTHAGYGVVIAKRHVVELHELSKDEIHQFSTDVAALGATVMELFQPVKIANLSMGFLCPHLHCHVFPQYPSDDPHALVNIKEGDVYLSDDDQQDRLYQMRRLLSSHLMNN